MAHSISVEIFKTNVLSEFQAETVLSLLRNIFPEMKINFDLDDCDKILRIAGTEIIPEYISYVMSSLGFECDQLN